MTWLVGRRLPLPWGTHDHTLWGKGPLSQVVAWTWHRFPFCSPWASLAFRGGGGGGRCSQWPGLLHRQPGPVRLESILLFCVWVEFDHLLDMFVHWRRALSVRFVSSALKKYRCLHFISLNFVRASYGISWWVPSGRSFIH